MTPPVVVELEQTCDGCPAQWQGRTADGRYVYVRYRWGWLQVGFGATFDEAIGDETILERLGGSYDGYLTYEELREATSFRVDWPA